LKPVANPPRDPATVDLSVQLGPLTLRNPVMTASGTFGYGPEYAELVDLDQLGAIVVKGICLEPTRGNPTPRTFEVSSGLLNAIGLQNPASRVFSGIICPSSVATPRR
jgi:dihydroorotate dehydrogenase (NAD+) catalytic subunit